jgi:hypothetical protein
MSGSDAIDQDAGRWCGSRARRELARLRQWLINDLFLATAVFSFVIIIPFAVILQNGVSLDGDGPFYLAVQQGFLDHGGPSISAFTEQLAREIGTDPLRDGRVIRGLNGKVYGAHFWLYPLLSVPFAIPLKLIGANTLYAFLLLNVASFAFCAWVLRRSTALGGVGKSIILFSLAITAVAWYVSWPHPEVFTACLLISASVLLLERRYLASGILVGAAAAHNPSAVLMFAVIGVFQLHSMIYRREARDAWAILGLGARLLPGLAIAAVPYIWSSVMFDVANPIIANGYIDYAQICWAKFVSLFFDWNQGFAIGFPFLLTVFAVVFVERLLNLRRHSMSPLQLGDVLIIATIAMAVPVLAQINFNAGQHYVSRYVAWLAAPFLVWAGLQIDRDDRLTALKGWLVGVGLYAVSYLVFFTHKIYYVLTIAPRGGPVYEDQTLFKPIAALILSAFPSLYNPWPEIFIERSLRHEVSMRPEEKESMTTGYKGADGSYLKILTRASTADAVSQVLCSAGAHLVDPGGRMLSMDSATDSALGYRYLNGAYRCQ